jgi:hypothetical protein
MELDQSKADAVVDTDSIVKKQLSRKKVDAVVVTAITVIKLRSISKVDAAVDMEKVKDILDIMVKVKDAAENNGYR